MTKLSNLGFTPAFANFLITILALIIGFQTTFEFLHSKWIKFDQTYGHSYIVILTVLIYIYTRRQELGLNKINYQYKVLPLIFLCSSITLVIELTLTMGLSQLFLIPILWLSCISFLGWAVGRNLLPYFGVLYFTIPIWDYATPALQYMTVLAANFLLSLFNISALIFDNYIQIGQGTFYVARGCSGLNYLITTLLLSCLYAIEYRLTLRNTLIVLLLATITSLISNWVRVFSLVLIGHYTSINNPIVQDHVLHGWIISFIFSLALFVTIHKFTNIPKQKISTQNKATLSSPLSWQAKLMLIPLAILVPKALILSLESFSTSVSQVLQANTLDYWQLSIDENRDLQLNNSDINYQLQLFNGYEHFQISVSGYTQQSQNKELINTENTYTPTNWSKSLHHLNKEPFKQEIFIDKAGLLHARQYWFELSNKKTSNTIEVKLLTALQHFLKDKTSLFISISSPCESLEQCHAKLKMLDELISSSKIKYAYNKLEQST